MSGEEIYKQRLRDAFSNSPMPDFQAQRDAGKSPLMPSAVRSAPTQDIGHPTGQRLHCGEPLYIHQQTKAKIRPCAALGCADYYYGSCCIDKCARYQPLA
jgi:hypothetical protein